MREAMGTEEHSEGSKEFNSVTTVDNPELVSSVQARLNNLNAITKEDEPAVSDEDIEDSTPDVTDDDTIEGDSQAESEDNSDDPTPENSTTKDDNGEEKVSIPDAYVRAAIHRGWKQEVIDELIESNPELAKKTLEATYLEVNNASREWSTLGRAVRDRKLEEQNKATTEQTADKTDLDVAPLVKKLKEVYTDDPLIDSVAKVLENTAKMANVKPQVTVQQGQDQYQTATARANAAANASTDQRVNNFFGANTMTPYNKFYGKVELGQSIDDLSSGQQQNRLAVLDNAEMIMVGHRMRGIELKVEEALEKAHFMVTEPIREQVIRDNLKATATKRKKSMTLRPSESKRTAKDEQGKPRNRKEFINKVERKLASVPGLR